MIFFCSILELLFKCELKTKVYKYYQNVRREVSCFGSSQYLTCHLKGFHCVCGTETGPWIIEGHESLQVKFVYKSWFFYYRAMVPALSLFSTVCFHTRDALQSSGTNYPPPLSAFSNFFKTPFTWLLSSNERKTNHHVKRTQLPSNWATV